MDIDKEGIILCGVHIGSRGELIAYDVVERVKSARRVLLDRHGVAGGDGLVVLHLVELLVIVRLVDVEGKVLHRLGFRILCELDALILRESGTQLHRHIVERLSALISEIHAVVHDLRTGPDRRRLLLPDGKGLILIACRGVFYLSRLSDIDIDKLCLILGPGHARDIVPDGKGDAEIAVARLSGIVLHLQSVRADPDLEAEIRVLPLLHAAEPLLLREKRGIDLKGIDAAVHRIDIVQLVLIGVIFPGLIALLPGILRLGVIRLSRGIPVGILLLYLVWLIDREIVLIVREADADILDLIRRRVVKSVRTIVADPDMELHLLPRHTVLRIHRIVDKGVHIGIYIGSLRPARSRKAGKEQETQRQNSRKHTVKASFSLHFPSSVPFLPAAAAFPSFRRESALLSSQRASHASPHISFSRWDFPSE